MLITLVLPLAITVITMVLLLQNPDPVTVSFLHWKLHQPLAFLLAGALMSGVLLGQIAWLVSFIRKTLIISRQRKIIEDLAEST